MRYSRFKILLNDVTNGIIDPNKSKEMELLVTPFGFELIGLISKKSEKKIPYHFIKIFFREEQFCFVEFMEFFTTSISTKTYFINCFDINKAVAFEENNDEYLLIKSIVLNENEE